MYCLCIPYFFADSEMTKKKKDKDIILTGKAKEKEIESLHKKEWRFPNRDCKKCQLYKCYAGQDADRCNCAKYGCVNFSPKDN